MLSSTRQLTTAFCARVAECRAQWTDLLAGTNAGDQACKDCELDRLYCSLAGALRSGARAGFPDFDPLAQRMQDSLANLRQVAGFGEPRVRALMINTLTLLERATRREPLGCEADRLLAEIDAATRDAAWAHHTRAIDPPQVH